MVLRQQVHLDFSLLGMCLTQVGTVSQRFVWLAHWRLRPASSSGTKVSRAVQGDRPTLVSCCRSNCLSEAHTQLLVLSVAIRHKAPAIGIWNVAGSFGAAVILYNSWWRVTSKSPQKPPNVASAGMAASVSRG